MSDDPFAPMVERSEVIRAMATPVVMRDASTLLALDLGTTTGWAILASGLMSSGSQSFAPRRFEGGGMRYLKFRRFLDELRGKETLDAVYFEEVRRHMGVDAAHAYGGFLAVLSEWCEVHRIPYEGVPVGEIKKSFTGKGNADKPMMIARAKVLGYSPVDDNEADAIALALLAAKR